MGVKVRNELNGELSRMMFANNVIKGIIQVLMNLYWKGSMKGIIQVLMNLYWKGSMKGIMQG